MNFDDAFERLIGNEGGYSNDPRDSGGETNFGITKAVAVANGFTGAMIDLRMDQAKTIYRRLYWDAAKCESLPADVRFHVFDGAVNSGVGQSAKWLQRAVNVMDDGVIGNQTIAACSAFPGYVTAAKYNGHRLEFMTGLKTWSAFGAGWARRIAHNLKAA